MSKCSLYSRPGWNAMITPWEASRVCRVTFADPAFTIFGPVPPWSTRVSGTMVLRVFLRAFRSLPLFARFRFFPPAVSGDPTTHSLLRASVWRGAARRSVGFWPLMDKLDGHVYHTAGFFCAWPSCLSRVSPCFPPIFLVKDDSRSARASTRHGARSVLTLFYDPL